MISIKRVVPVFSFLLLVVSCDNDNGMGPKNAPPVVRFDYSSPVCDQAEITFDASGTYDPDGEITQLRWSFGDGSGATGWKAAHEFTHTGYHDVTLTATDDGGANASKTVRLNVQHDVGCYVLKGYQWSSARSDGYMKVRMYIDISFSRLDPNWTDVGSNTAARAMAEWHYRSHARIWFNMPVEEQGLKTKRDGYNAIWVGPLDGAGGLAGQATAHIVNGEVVEVDIQIDEAESWGVNGESGKVDLQSVLTHEMGHLWRLGDLPTSNTSCQWETMASAPRGTTHRRTLYCGDKRGVQAIYGYEAAKPTGPASFNVDQVTYSPPDDHLSGDDVCSSVTEH